MTKSHSEVIEEQRRKHGERVEARQRERVPPCRGHDRQQSLDEGDMALALLGPPD